MKPRRTVRIDAAERRPQDRIRPEDAAAVLVGAGVGLAAFGFAEQWYRILDPTPLTARLVWGAVFGGLSVGPGLPPALALWIGTRAFRRGATRTALRARLTVSQDVDQGTLWTVLAGLALVAGLALLGLPLLVSCGRAAYETLLGRFVWGTATLTALEALLIAVTAVPVFALLGWLISCVPIVTRSAERWDPRSGPWILLGAAFGILVPVGIGEAKVPPPVWIVAGAVPFLVVAIVSVQRSQVHAGRLRAGRETDAPAPLDARDPWPSILRAAEAIGAVTLVVALFGWCRAVSILARCERGATLGFWGVGLAAVAGGWGWSCRRDWTRIGSVGALGAVCVAAGIAMAVPLAVIACVSPDIGPRPTHGPWFWLLVATCVSVPAFSGGYVTGSAAGAALGRMGNRPTVGSALLSRAALSVSACLYVILWPVLAALGTYALLAAAALTLLALGGVLIIHEPTTGHRPRTRRVAWLFLIVIVMTLILPRPAQTWLVTRTGERLRLLESQWLTVSQWRDGAGQVQAEPLPHRRAIESRFARSPVGGPLLSMENIPRDARVMGLFGVSFRLMSELGLHLPAETLHSFDPSVRGRSAPHEIANDRTSPTSATRALRTKHDLAVVVTDLHTLSPAVRDRLLSTGFLPRMRGALGPDGMAILLVPVQTMSPDELDRWIQGVRTVSGDRLGWTCLNTSWDSVLVLVFGNDGQWRERWSRWSRHPLRPASELP